MVTDATPAGTPMADAPTAPAPAGRSVDQHASPTPAAAGQARRVAINAAFPFAATMVGRVLSWGMAIVMARTLGPAGSGAYAFAVNLWLYASIIADFGLGTWLTREIARSPHSARDVVRLSVGVRLLITLPAFAGLAGISLLYAASRVEGIGADVVLTTVLLGLGLFPGAFSAAGTALYNAHERMVFPAAIQLLSALVTTCAGATLLLAGYGIVALGAVSLAVNLVTAGIFVIAAGRQHVPLEVAFDLRRQYALIRETVPLMLNSLLNNVFFRVDIQVLQTQGSAVVGNYANAYKVLDAAGAVPSSVVLALFPVLSRRAAGDGRDGLLGVYTLALKLLLVMALPLAVLLTYAAHELTLLSWGPEFLPHAAIALQILVWFLPLSFFNGLTQYVLIALGLQRRITVAFALAAVFNLGTNLLLIPRFSYLAAGATTIATELVLLVPFLTALRSHLDLRPVGAAVLSTLPPALLLSLFVWLVPAPSRLAIAALAGALYPLLVWVTGTFSHHERALLLSVARRRDR